MFKTSLCLVLTLFAISNTSLAAVEKTSTVVVMGAEQIASFERLTYPARVLATVDAKISADFDGTVVQVVRPLGSRVTRGETILKIQRTDPVYQYEPAAITAPVSGIVGDLKVGPGTQLLRGQSLATVTDPSKIKILIEVAASDIGLVKQGQRAQFKLNGTELEIPLQVKGLSPVIDPATGTSTCELEQIAPGKLAGPKPKSSANSLVQKEASQGETLPALKLYPGLVGQVWMKANEREAIQVPEHAVYYKGNESFLRIVTEGKAKKIPVKLGAKASGLVEILGGIKAGDQIVVRSSGFLADDEKVEVQAKVDAKGNPVQ